MQRIILFHVSETQIATRNTVDISSLEQSYPHLSSIAKEYYNSKEQIHGSTIIIGHHY
jgi:hypothetical protein